MKLPEPLFVLINPFVGFLLRSPLHRFWSRSLMLITFTGRKTGRVFTTPVRFVRNGDVVRCFTSSENLWWRNLRGGADVSLLIEGKTEPFHAVAIHDDPEEIRKWLVHYLGMFPNDAAYHGIRLEKDKRLNPDDLEMACHQAVVVEARGRSPGSE